VGGRGAGGGGVAGLARGPAAGAGAGTAGAGRALAGVVPAHRRVHRDRAGPHRAGGGAGGAGGQLRLAAARRGRPPARRRRVAGRGRSGPRHPLLARQLSNGEIGTRRLTMKRPLFLIVPLLMAGPALAQEKGKALRRIQEVREVHAVGIAGGDGVENVRFAWSAEAFEGKQPVKNAPYSAVGVTELEQTLGDGNRIKQTTKSQLA